MFRPFCASVIFYFYKYLIRFAIFLFTVDMIAIVTSSPGQWLACLGSAVEIQRGSKGHVTKRTMYDICEN